MVCVRRVLVVVAVTVAVALTSAATAEAPATSGPSPREAAVAALGRVLLDPDVPLPWRSPSLPSWTLPSVNLQCARDLALFSEGFSNRATWALQMFDASTKVPDGIMFGNLVHLGNFDECLAVRRGGAGGPTFDGQHCLISLTVTLQRTLTRSPESNFSVSEELMYVLETGQFLPFSKADVLRSAISLPVQVAWCAPSSCSPGDIEKAVVAALASTKLPDGINIAAKVLPSQCHTPEGKTLRGIDIFAICLLGVFVCCAVLSTLYDVATLEQGQRHPLLLAFSVYSNWPRLLTITNGPDQLGCLNGIRTISIGWVVLGHVYLVNAALPAINAGDYLPDFIKGFDRLTIMNATVSVDTFFMMSGLLLSFLFLKEVEKTNRFNIIKFYVHRYVRLTPPLAIMVFLSVTLFNYMGTGPLWDSRHNSIRDSCDKNWWTNLLYINNYVHPQDMCLGHTWYLAVDMQLHILSPLVLIPLWKFPKRFARYWIYFLLLAGWAIPFAIVYIRELQPGTYVGASAKRSQTMKEYYWPTHTRYVPWLLGILLGDILRDCRKKKPELPGWMTTCCWIISTVLMTGALNAAYPFQQPDYKYNRVEAAFWLSLFRGLWAVGLGWIIFACDQGIGGLVNKILSWNFFQPLARLSYGVYLTHITILNLFAGVIQSPIYLADVNAIPQFFGVLIMSVAWAIPMALLFESPIIIIDKVIFGGGRRPQAANDRPQSEKPPEYGVALSNGAPKV